MPYCTFGKYVSVHRTEIEQLNELRALLGSYVANRADTRPFCLAVFGPPGSGKSFAINELVGEMLGDEVKTHRFDLSQFGDGMEDLERAFEFIRDSSISNRLSCVVWDEFDTGNLMWLKYLIGPMQDREYTVAGLGHPFGKSIFVFAGGTCERFAQFDEVAMSMKAEKAPDFVSRLRAYVDIQGINALPEDKWLEGMDSVAIRRAILLRTYLERYHRHLIDNEGFASIEDGVVQALVFGVEEYRHGARSLEQIVSASTLAGQSKFRSYHLPSDAQARIHAKPSELQRLCDEGEQAKVDTDVWANEIWNAMGQTASFGTLLPSDRARYRFYARIVEGIIKRSTEDRVLPSVTAARYVDANNVNLASHVYVNEAKKPLRDVLFDHFGILEK